MLPPPDLVDRNGGAGGLEAEGVAVQEDGIDPAPPDAHLVGPERVRVGMQQPCPALAVPLGVAALHGVHVEALQGGPVDGERGHEDAAAVAIGVLVEGQVGLARRGEAKVEADGHLYEFVSRTLS